MANQKGYLDTFERTLQKSHEWITDLMEKLDFVDYHQSYHALRTVLHVLRDHLPLNETAHLGAQLPMLIRGMYYDSWAPRKKPQVARSEAEFLDAVAKYYPLDMDADLKQIIREVFSLVQENISEGEVNDLLSNFKPQVRALLRPEKVEA